jgi:hypothetical protein
MRKKAHDIVAVFMSLLGSIPAVHIPYSHTVLKLRLCIQCVPAHCNLRFCQWRGNASWRKEGGRERKKEEEGERDMKKGKRGRGREENEERAGVRDKERGERTDRENKGRRRVR